MKWEKIYNYQKKKNNPLQLVTKLKKEFMMKLNWNDNNLFSKILKTFLYEQKNMISNSFDKNVSLFMRFMSYHQVYMKLMVILRLSKF